MLHAHASLRVKTLVGEIKWPCGGSSVDESNSLLCSGVEWHGVASNAADRLEAA